MVTAAREGNFPRRLREIELKEKKKAISWKGIPETVDDLTDARSIRNEELPETLQSEAFDVAFQEPNFRTNRRLNVF